MAEAVAVVGLVASILQFVDFGSKLVERVNDFVTSTKDVPETFRNITVQLPVAISTLQRFRSRIDRDELSESDAHALEALVDRSLGLIKDVNRVVEKAIPARTSSSFEKRLLAIRSLLYDKKVQQKSAQLIENVNYLTLFQAIRLQDHQPVAARQPTDHRPSTVTNTTSFQFGLNLGGAPRVAEGSFVGRNSELDQLSIFLHPKSSRQSLVAVVGMGGIGKTQLCIEYAISHQEQYSSIFWVSGRDEVSFRADLLTLAEIILPDQTSSLTTRAEENALIQRIRRWFSQPENATWLLIVDNLDNPKVPGNSDPSSFDIREYFPYRSQGMILITTRSRKMTFAKQLYLQKLATPEQGLEILRVHSGRALQDDENALNLATRLDGLPLALASAASFLERTSCTVSEYLDEYERNWLEQNSNGLLEYGDRTLFTTWNLSLEKLKSHSPGAAELLRILAFFGGENINHQLLAAQNSVSWPGLRDVLRNKASFDRVMGKLRDYSLVETSDKSYRLHPCLHDWTLLSLNQHVEERDIWLALGCIAVTSSSSSSFWSTDYDESLAQLLPHALRLTHPHLLEVLTRSALDESRATNLRVLGDLLFRAERFHEALGLARLLFEWLGENLGPEYAVTLTACNLLGTIHLKLQNYTEAEDLLKQAVHGLEQTSGRRSAMTLDAVHNLALLYTDLDRLEDAEAMFLWSLRGCEETYGPEDPNTFWAIMALGDFYIEKGELSLAETQLSRSLKGFDAAIGTDHWFSRRTASRLGKIYQQQEKLTLAATIYQRVYESCLRLLGPDHWTTLEARVDLDSVIMSSKFEIGVDSGISFGDAIKGDAIHSSPLKLQTVPVIPYDLSKLVHLNCHECKIPLTAITQRFVCCMCAEHEVCGRCSFTTRALQATGGDSGKHFFLQCDLPPITVGKERSATQRRVWGSEVKADSRAPTLMKLHLEDSGPTMADLSKSLVSDLAKAPSVISYGSTGTGRWS